PRRHGVLDHPPERAPPELLHLLLHPVEVGRDERRPGLPQRLHRLLTQLLYNRLGQVWAVHRYPPPVPRALCRPRPPGGTILAAPGASPRADWLLTIVWRTRRHNGGWPGRARVG